MKNGWQVVISLQLTLKKGHSLCLLNEYNASCRWEPVSLYKACWVESDDPAELEAFKKRKYQYMAKDREGRDVFLADSGYVLQYVAVGV